MLGLFFRGFESFENFVGDGFLRKCRCDRILRVVDMRNFVFEKDKLVKNILVDIIY